MERTRPLRSRTRFLSPWMYPAGGTPLHRVLSAFLAVPLLLSSGCSMGYLWHLGKGQARILMGMQPVEAVVQCPDTDPAARDKILLIQQAKSFGEEVLGLAPSKSYTYYYAVENPPLGYNLSACPPLSLEPYLWCFPIAGCVPYKGFFQQERAERERDRMAALGYDVYFRPLVAYSTLGWFPDPIFSTWLQGNRAFLVETVLHEMVHGTIYTKNESAFNESLATFIGERGAVAFFRHQGGEPDAFFQGLDEARRAREVFRDEMNHLAERLRELYASASEPSVQLGEKERLYREAKQALQERLSPEQARRLARVFRTDWNNAFLVTHLTYHHDLDLWEEVLERFDGDLGAMVDWLKPLHGVQDPLGHVRSWLGNPETDNIVH